MIVCIAEKPSVAKDIAKVIGANTTKDGYMEGNGYQVTWTFGHLCCLKEPHDYNPFWRSWDLETLPMIPFRFGIKLIEGQGYDKQFAIIEKLMSNAEYIINCGDAGQEGELIQRWVISKAKVKSPVKRLWISSMTEEAIREGFNNLKPQEEYTSLYEAGLCRAIGDWLLGMNATRLYTLKYRQSRNQVLSIGRVQTPTLAMIVKRHMEIQHFKPEQYWVLSTIYRNTLFTLRQVDEENEDTTGSKSRITSEEEGRKAFEQIKDKPFSITSIAKKNGTEAPPRLFDLTSLQVECNRKFSFSAEETLKYIQNLYEKKLTTYPRVDTTYLPDDIYPKCPKILQSIIPYLPIIQPLDLSKLKKSKKVFDTTKVTDHHAIIPTGVSPSNGDITYNEKQVYDLITRRFIAVFYPDCKFATTTAIGKVEKLQFKASGKQIVDKGWRAVMEWGHVQAQESESEENEHKNEEKLLPDFVKGESGPHEPTLSEKWTTPPKPYTEATLLRAMETAGKTVENEELRDLMKENGIGRPSTRAAIIETLFKRNYIKKERKSLTATETGISLIQTIQTEQLKSAELTGYWEKKLRDIEYHRYDAQQFISELKSMVTDVVNQVKTGQTHSPLVAAKEGHPCPVCHKGTVIRGKTSYGCSEWRSGCTFRQPFEQND